MLCSGKGPKGSVSKDQDYVVHSEALAERERAKFWGVTQFGNVLLNAKERKGLVMFVQVTGPSRNFGLTNFDNVRT